MARSRWAGRHVVAMFLGLLLLSLTAMPVTTSALTPTPAVTATAPPQSNRCDQKHPDEGRDAQGHNNPKCAPVPPTNTPVPPTNTPVPPTNTPVPPTNTPVPPTNTPVPPTNTPVPPTNTPGIPTSTPVPCNLQTNSGGEGVTTTVHELGATSGTFEFVYDAYGIPDQFDIYYEGNLIYTTGGAVSGSATVPVSYSGTATSITVVVTGPSGTAWDYVVSCPTPA